MTVRKPEKFVSPDYPAPDAVDGADPSIGYVGESSAYRVTCDCGMSFFAGNREDAEALWREHHRWGHPANRNPELTCHAIQHWIDRWCVRPKGHEGPHWTPSYDPTGAGSWWPQ